MSEGGAADLAAFNWAHLPRNDSEFEALMRAIDHELMRRGLQPPQRPLHVCRLLWEAFGWGGNFLPDKRLAEHPGFAGDVLLAKAYNWYDQVFAERLNTDGAIAFVPVRLANAIWRARLPLVFGTCQFFMHEDLKNAGTKGVVSHGPARLNVLTCIEGFTPGLCKRISEAEYLSFFEFFVRSFAAMNWRVALTGNVYFVEAIADFSSSVDDLMAQRFAQARWAAAQSVEKTLKGVLNLAKVSFDIKGSSGHDLLKLGKLVNAVLDTAIPEIALSAAMCSPGVRYGEQVSSEAQALDANHAALEIFGVLSRSIKLSRLTRVEAEGPPPLLVVGN